MQILRRKSLLSTTVWIRLKLFRTFCYGKTHSAPFVPCFCLCLCLGFALHCMCVCVCVCLTVFCVCMRVVSEKLYKVLYEENSTTQLSCTLRRRRRRRRRRGRWCFCFRHKSRNFGFKLRRDDNVRSSRTFRTYFALPCVCVCVCCVAPFGCSDIRAYVALLLRPTNNMSKERRKYWQMLLAADREHRARNRKTPLQEFRSFCFSFSAQHF